MGAATLVGCNAELRQRTECLLNEDAQGDHKLFLSTGFRTFAEQTRLYLLACVQHPLNPTAWAAKPGTSNHEKGLAVDIGANNPESDLTYRKKLGSKWGLLPVLANEAWHFELDPKRKPIALLTPTPPTITEATKILGKKAVKIMSTKSGNGYWVVASDGGVFSFGDAAFYGSAGAAKLAAPICDAQRTKSGKGYWLLGEDGGVFCFGDAQMFGTPAKDNVIGYAA